MRIPNILGLLRQELVNPTATFHAGQEEAIRSERKPQFCVLVIQATQWGKSMVCFLRPVFFEMLGGTPPEHRFESGCHACFERSESNPPHVYMQRVIEFSLASAGVRLGCRFRSIGLRFG